MERRFETVLMQDLSVSETYDLLTGTIAPRPIAFVTSLNGSGVPNLAPFSFFVLGGANPASIVFSAIVNADGTEKETFRNISDTGEFVVNSVHREMMTGVNQAALQPTPDISKWDRSGFTPVQSRLVKPPRLAESLVQFECRLFKIIEHGDGPGSARYVVGEVIAAHISEELFADGQLSPALMHPIARMGGKVYVDTEAMELFE